MEITPQIFEKLQRNTFLDNADIKEYFTNRERYYGLYKNVIDVCFYVGMYQYEFINSVFIRKDRINETMFMEGKMFLVINNYTSRLTKKKIKDYYMVIGDHILEETFAEFGRAVIFFAHNDLLNLDILCSKTIVCKSQVPEDFELLMNGSVDKRIYSDVVNMLHSLEEEVEAFEKQSTQYKRSGNEESKRANDKYKTIDFCQAATRKKTMVEEFEYREGSRSVKKQEIFAGSTESLNGAKGVPKFESLQNRFGLESKLRELEKKVVMKKLENKNDIAQLFEKRKAKKAKLEAGNKADWKKSVQFDHALFEKNEVEKNPHGGKDTDTGNFSNKIPQNMSDNFMTFSMPSNINSKAQDNVVTKVKRTTNLMQNYREKLKLISSIFNEKSKNTQEKSLKKNNPVTIHSSKSLDVTPAMNEQENARPKKSIVSFIKKTLKVIKGNKKASLPRIDQKKSNVDINI